MSLTSQEATLNQHLNRRLLKGTNKTVHRIHEKRAVTPQETEPDLPVSVWESLAETGKEHSPTHQQKIGLKIY